MLTRSLVTSLGLALLAACGQPSQVEDFALNSLSADAGAPNQAVLFSSTGGDLPGVQTDVNELAQVLRDQAFGMAVQPNHEASLNDMIARTAAAAVRAGEKGTLLFFYAGHGDESGDLVPPGDRTLPFHYITDAIASERAKAGLGPLERFIVILDSCYSGQIAQTDGGQPILNSAKTNADTPAPGGSYSSTSSSGEQRGGATVGMTGSAVDRIFGARKETNEELRGSVARLLDGATAKGVSAAAGAAKRSQTQSGALYRQLLVMAAASANQTAADLGAKDGGAFTFSLRKAFAELKGISGATIGDLVTRAQNGVKVETFVQKAGSVLGIQSQQMPQYRAESIEGGAAAVLGDKLFE